MAGWQINDVRGVEHLRQRLLREREQHAACERAGASGVARVRTSSAHGAAAARERVPVPLVDHGPPVASVRPVNFYVWTSGVV